MPRGSDIVVYCDGGSNRSGIAYGSYRIDNRKIVTVTHGPKLTSNQAEYMTLISALRDVFARYYPLHHKLIFYMDSQLVVYHLDGRYSCQSPKLLPLYRTAATMLSGFADWEGRWVPRKIMVSLFGH